MSTQRDRRICTAVPIETPFFSAVEQRKMYYNPNPGMAKKMKKDIIIVIIIICLLVRVVALSVT